MKFKKITYKIAQSRFGLLEEPITVTGYATDFYPVRLCVRRESKRVWKVDHFDTGCAIAIPFYESTTRAGAFVGAARKVFKNIINGEYQKAVRQFEKRMEAA